MKVRPVRLLVVFGYVLPVVAAAVLLVTVGDWFLSVCLVVTEAVVVAATRLSQRWPEPGEGGTGPRLGTPNDPGRPSGRKPPSRWAQPAATGRPIPPTDA